VTPTAGDEARDVLAPHRIDRVAAAGALVALAACLALPFAVLRANQIVNGTPHAVYAAGIAGWLLLAASAAALAASAIPRPGRGPALLVAADAMTAALSWAVGQSAVRLLAGQPAVARVSIGTSAWLALAGTAVVWFAAAHASRSAWQKALAALIAVGGFLSAAQLGGLARLGIVAEYNGQGGTFWQALETHLWVAGAALGIAVVIGVPLGVLSARAPKVRAVLLSVVGIIQTVPSLALLGLLVVPLAALGLPGIGPLPAIIALTLYALLPIVRNTFVGLAAVDPAIVDAGRGMGMSRSQLLLRVEAPLALPLVIEGVRSSAVLTIGIAAVMAFVGVNTLGQLVFTGIGQAADDLVLLGAVPMVVLAILADVALRLLARAVVSPGIRQGA
jgi:osmoprotectant transport system permease protein